MQQSVTHGQGGMAVIIGLEDATVEFICSEMQTEHQLVSPANYNAIGQVVVAGEIRALNRLIDKTKEAGAKIAKILPVSVPSHCMMMTPAADALLHILQDVNLTMPTVPVLSNVDATVHLNPTLAQEKLCQQLIAPVQWVRSIQAMAKHGITDHLEIGPGRVLTGLCKRTNRDIHLHCLDAPEALDSIITLMQEEY